MGLFVPLKNAAIRGNLKAVANTLVIGSGIIGLACATKLQDAGHSVAVVSRESVENTTSAVAAAVWYPYLAEPKDRVLGWSIRSRQVLESMAERPAAAIRLGSLLELFTQATPDPWWREGVEEFRRPRADALPAGFVDGYEVRVPVVESLPHMRFLLRNILARGGRVSRRSLIKGELDDLVRTNDLVVNCAGLGARELCGDNELYAVRGQVVRVAQPHGAPISRCIIADDGPHGISYIVPRETDVILGGTADVGAELRDPDPSVTARILRAAAAFEPALIQADILEVRVGLRPCRPRVRLERDARGVIHCYGHGGSGFTLAWGCAEEVVSLA